MPSKKIIDDLSISATSVGISKCNDEMIDKLRASFAFDPEFKLQLAIDEAESWYYSISENPKKSTFKQTRDRLNKVNNLIVELKGSFSNLSVKENISLMRASENRRIKFKSNDNLRYLNQLSLIIRSSIRNDLDKVSRNGRVKKTENRFFLDELHKAFEVGTSKVATCSYDDYQCRYKSKFVDFCEQVINILGLPIYNSSIGEFMKSKGKNGD
ncbi:hypothetical protein [Brumicola pallidula]|uniref:Uncharacterized protein n=1 Tax=Brumicola pallidula DSM 14239 = ACAM 615 TaxID=1121922 RepID=K6Y656_9ALTE|nr:hypothetical protein [Glaciecola pallidula]GAC28264.1 hypothetical protein GPAL_1391 [Glaciecola pallidula DSM 14239 = ACAM 615]